MTRGALPGTLSGRCRIDGLAAATLRRARLEQLRRLLLLAHVTHLAVRLAMELLDGCALVARKRQHAKHGVIAGGAERDLAQGVHADVEQVQQRGDLPRARVCLLCNHVRLPVVTGSEGALRHSEVALDLLERHRLRGRRRIDREGHLPHRHTAFT